MEQVPVLQDEKVLAIQRRMVGVVAEAEVYLIDTEDTARVANNILRGIAEAKKELEERRKFFVKPLNDHVKTINALFRDVSEPLNKADGIMRSKVIEWRKKIEAAARKKEAELRLKAEKQRQKQEEKAAVQGKPAPPPPPMPVVEAPKTVGGVTVTKPWTFVVFDMSQVPQEYLVLDEVKVRRDIRAGIRAIPGIRIYQQDVIKVGR